jgi:REP element-mobilizing transposase RayT
MSAPYNPEIHHRRSIRLTNYDYFQVGAYFITICTTNRECLFWHVGAYCETPGLTTSPPLNDLGRIVEEEWRRTPAVRPHIELDAFVVMPNHFHAIVVITPGNNTSAERPEVRGVYQYTPTKDRARSPSQTIGAVVRGFKSAVTTRVNASRGAPGFPLWQRNYYEHVIRNETDLTRVRDYIANNPARWAEDEDNPTNIKPAPS